MQNYNFTHWTYRGALKELASVLSFNKVEEAYESKVEAKEYMEAARTERGRALVSGEEKHYVSGREFEKSEWLFSPG